MDKIFLFLSLAFEKTHKKEFYKYWFSGSIGVTIALLLLLKNFFGFPVEKSAIGGVLLFLVIWLIRFSYFFIRSIIAFLFGKYKESIYGDAIVLLNEAFANIHSLRKNEVFNDGDFKTCLSIVCDKLKVIFDKKTGGTCGVSIKAILVTNKEAQINSDAIVFNLARDKASTYRNTEKYLEIKHQVFSNTCYNVIFDNISKGRKKKLFYINNDIPPTRPSDDETITNKVHSDIYMNTSYDVYEKGLPYRSEIVCPIIPIIFKDKLYNLVGFICVDCTKKNAFDTNYDNHILAGVSDGIYDLFTAKIDSNQ
jgi:hypothetical protein